MERERKERSRKRAEEGLARAKEYARAYRRDPKFRELRKRDRQDAMFNAAAFVAVFVFLAMLTGCVQSCQHGPSLMPTTVCP